MTRDLFWYKDWPQVSPGKRRDRSERHEAGPRFDPIAFFARLPRQEHDSKKHIKGPCPFHALLPLRTPSALLDGCALVLSPISRLFYVFWVFWCWFPAFSDVLRCTRRDPGGVGTDCLSCRAYFASGWTSRSTLSNSPRLLSLRGMYTRTRQCSIHITCSTAQIVKKEDLGSELWVNGCMSHNG